MFKPSSQSAASPAGACSSPMSTNLLKRKHVQARSAASSEATQLSVRTLRKALAVAKMRALHGKEGSQEARIAELEAQLNEALRQEVGDEVV